MNEETKVINNEETTIVPDVETSDVELYDDLECGVTGNGNLGLLVGAVIGVGGAIALAWKNRDKINERREKRYQRKADKLRAKREQKLGLTDGTNEAEVPVVDIPEVEVEQVEVKTETKKKNKKQ